MRALARRRTVLVATAGLLAACAPTAAQRTTAPTPAPRRFDIVPVVEYHQHIAGPTAVAYIAPPPPLPAIALPADLAARSAACREAPALLPRTTRG